MSLPYFPMYPTDFEAKTSHLTLAEDGAYNRLLRICWMTPGCTMPADEAWIMRRARAVSDHEQEAVRAVLAEFFTIENGRYSNAKLMRVFREANEAHEKRKNAGAMGGKAKSLQAKEKTPSKAKAMPKQPEPEPEPEQELNNTQAKACDGQAVDDDFAKQVFDRGVSYLGRHGVSERQARSFIGKLRRDHTDPDIFAAFSECSKSGAIDPIPWITRRLTPEPSFKASDLQLDLSHINPDGSLKHDTKPH